MKLSYVFIFVSALACGGGKTRPNIRPEIDDDTRLEIELEEGSGVELKQNKF